MDTPAGPVFGCNLDLFIPGDGLVFVNPRGLAKEGFQPGTTGEVAKWVSKYGSVTFNLAGREFAFGGMNEAGLVIGSMELRASRFPEPDERPGVTAGTWAQYVLDTCGNVDEAIRVDSRVRIEDSTPPVHFLIADADGNCAAVEWLDGRCVYRTGESLPVKAMSNMRYERALAAYQRGGPRWWWSNPGRSAERFADAQARMSAFDPAGDIDPVTYAFETLTRVVAAPHTKWNIVYDISKREIWYRSVESPAVKHLSLRDFDFSCETPVLMLDVNAALEGDVNGAFVPYDHDVNQAMFRTLCARFELEVSAETADRLMQLFEGFDCAR
jgi:penicillin V acylase-like amidase (Ntn superfamily)